MMRPEVSPPSCIDIVGLLALSRAVPTFQPTDRTDEEREERERQISLCLCVCFIFFLFFVDFVRCIPPGAARAGAGGSRSLCLCSMGPESGQIDLVPARGARPRALNNVRSPNPIRQFRDNYHIAGRLMTLV